MGRKERMCLWVCLEEDLWAELFSASLMVLRCEGSGSSRAVLFEVERLRLLPDLLRERPLRFFEDDVDLLAGALLLLAVFFVGVQRADAEVPQAALDDVRQ